MPDALAPPATAAQADSPELAALKRDNALLQQRVAQLEQTKKLVDAVTPTLPEGAKGTVSLAGEPLESRLLAYREIDRGAEGISDRVRPKVGKAAVIVHDAAALASPARYRAFTAQLTQDTTSVQRDLDVARNSIAARAEADAHLESVTMIAQALPMVASAAPKSITGMIALFRQDVAVASATLTIADTTLVAAVCGHLAGEGIRVYHPSLLAPARSPASSGVLKQLDTVWELRARSQSLLGEIARAKQGRPDAETTVLSAAQARVTSVIAGLDDLRDSLAKPDAISGLTPLADLLRAEALADVAADAFVLWVKISAASGTSEVRQPGTFQRGGTPLQRRRLGRIPALRRCGRHRRRWDLAALFRPGRDHGGPARGKPDRL
jgi:hypothetical protein